MKLEKFLKPGTLPPPASRAEKALSGLAGNFDGFYIGEEFCENLLPSPERLAAGAGALLAAGAKVCVLTPPVSDKGLAGLARLYRALKKLKAGALELTVNDFGALELARQHLRGVALNAGRALHHNAFRLDKNAMRVIDPRCLDGFAELGIRRFEISAGAGLRNNFREAAGRPEARGFSLTLHYPWCSVTSARTCLLGTPDIAHDGSVRGIECHRECRLASFEIEHPRIKEKLFMRGNALFLKKAEIPAEKKLLAARIDRLVYDPFK